MYSAFQLTIKYLQYYLAASSSGGHGVHSPFVFDFIKNVLTEKKIQEKYERLEDLRNKLRGDQSVLAVQDYGAGSLSKSSGNRTVASVARRAVKSRKYAQLLFRIVQYYQPSTMIELGTSLGLTTCHLSMANPGGQVFTFEGSEAIAAVARQNFKALDSQNIKLTEGNFDYTLPAVLYYQRRVDFAFIDGNHRREPTLRYFELLLAKSSAGSIFIFDDIHWSREMEQAWNTIKENGAVRCTIDLFFFGIVFFRQEFREKQHFTIRF